MRRFLACAGVLAASSLVIFAFQPFGQVGWHLAFIGIALAGLLLGPKFWPARWRAGAGHRLEWRSASRTLIACLAAWLGLVLWSDSRGGGPAPEGKEDANAIRVLTWNVLRGADDGLPWLRFRWNVRAKALGVALEQAHPDVLCVQEALAGQVDFLQQVLPDHARVGVGRDDGRSGGEHCAIYFDRGRFQELESGTFWLDGPADSPPPQTPLWPRRTCTWVRLEERRTGRRMRVYNTHFSLMERPREAAARRVLEHIAAADRTDSLVVAGDFNAPPNAPSRTLFTKSGLVSSFVAVGQTGEQPTNHFYGIRLRSLDAVLLDRNWNVDKSQILDVKPGNTFPSDHFSVLADLRLRSIHVQ